MSDSFQGGGLQTASKSFSARPAKRRPFCQPRFFALVLLLSFGSLGVAAARYYWPVTVAKLASGTNVHTHVELDSVVVAYVAVEGDSDFHERLRDRGDTLHFVIGECIPALPCRHPHVGEVLPLVRGISRYDPEHHWWEVHPIEQQP